MRKRVTFECQKCEAEISHFAEMHLMQLAQASGWKTLPLLHSDDLKWRCPVCVSLDLAATCPRCDSNAEECATCGGIGPDPFFAGPVS